MAKKKRWSYSKGDYGHTVSAWEEVNGVIYGRRPSEQPQSLGHRDRERAKLWVRETHAKLTLGIESVGNPTPTVTRITSLYLEHHSPNRGRASQQHDRRTAEMWTQALGADKDLHALTRGEWEGFSKARKSGAIDARGNSVPEGKRRPVRQRAVAYDLQWLRGIILWATTWQDREGRYLMRENPARGFKIPSEKNVKRPVATQDRFEETRAKSDQVSMTVWRNGCRHETRSCLSELLDLANGTGRRISAICQLQYVDLQFSEGPHGSIRWPEDTDKAGKEWLTPINATVRKALDRIKAERLGIGTAYLFPSPRNARRPISKDLASDWLRKAEALAGLKPLDGSLWHAYRRKWATERKDLPDRDVAAAGGWSDLTSLKTAYQQPDTATLYRVVSEPNELREAHNA